MSVQSAKAFLEKMNLDKAYAQAFSAAKTGNEKMAIAKSAGFEFSLSEINEVLSDFPLSDQDLDAVSGGVTADTMSADGSCPGCWFW
jgi:predicted ribosomally synthesized peptide with nif11-like leader